ncbi:hypothetical protein QQS21_011939 [Conoideocrella luteorostrata]|uniref:NACHT domain-containing protein n=1 Tax=Conoideocrella luteorostrata TaxID=1105319 RepID=A0AAJ0CGP2_9HYPO|nr:hypothetical protein QQS21_011939 [Conoideocrella luteorostrata]
MDSARREQTGAANRRAKSGDGVRLVKIHPAGDATDTDVDIIAIHGLDTKSPDTWIWKDPKDVHNVNKWVNWLDHPEMLPKEVGRARIFYCDWPADLFMDRGLSEKPLEVFGRLLLEGIGRHREEGTHRPILFIASCLGGIILAQALILADLPRSDYAAVRRATRGVIFLATPFGGTSFNEIAKWAEPGLRVWGSVRVRGRVMNSLLDILKNSSNVEVMEIVIRFTALCTNPDHPCRVFTFYEGRTTSLSRRLVDRHSGTLQIVADPLVLDRRHVLMNKFRGPECPHYKLVSGKIKDFLEYIRAGMLLRQADDCIRRTYFGEQGGWGKSRLQIQRLSGAILPMDQCYINLTIVRGSSEDIVRFDERPMSSSFSLYAPQPVKTPEKTSDVELSTLFDLCQGEDLKRRKGGFSPIQPRRILIRGRAGIGKTTLCKKIVHDFYTQNTQTELQRSWSTLFDRILWIPLRNLKRDERRMIAGYNYESLFLYEYFTLPTGRPDLAKELAESLGKISSRTLFLLDGLDEVSQDLGEGGMRDFLELLLNQQNVIITSRPSAALPNGVHAPDLELETIGFHADQIKTYIEKSFTDFTDPQNPEPDQKKVDAVQSFLKKHQLIQGLVRIPIQLDALCYTWDDLDPGSVPETMTGIYQGIEQRLWKKDVLRLEKRNDAHPVTARQIETSGAEALVRHERHLLEGLAFSGLHEDIVDYTSSHLELVSKQFTNPGFLLDEKLPKLSFLRTSDPTSKAKDRNYHFIHLTFQEYFAARYFVRQWKELQGQLELLVLRGGGESEINFSRPVEFLRKHKYTARYDIFWRFVAGLLDQGGQANFVNIIEQEPLDLLGPTHQRLIMRCLGEIHGKLPMREALEQRLSQWLLFEYSLNRSAELASEAEFPEQALEIALSEVSGDALKTILQSLAKRPSIPTNIAKLIVAQFNDSDKSVRAAAVEVLEGRTDLSDADLDAVNNQLEDRDSDVRRAAVRVLGRQAKLRTKDFNDVLARRDDEDWDVQATAAKVIRRRRDLTAENREALLARSDYKDWYPQQTALKFLEGPADRPGEALTAVLTQLDDDESADVREGRAGLPGALAAVVNHLNDENFANLREAGVRLLPERPDLLYKTPKPNFTVPQAQIDLSDAVLETVLAQIDDEDSHVRRTAIIALELRDKKPDKAVKAVVDRLDDKDVLVRRAAVEFFKGPAVLPDEDLEDMVTRLKDGDSYVRRAAVEVLGRRAKLPGQHFDAVVELLDDQDADVRQAVVNSFRGRAAPSQVDLKAVAKRLADKHSYVRRAAVEVLGWRADLDSDILETIEALLKGEDDMYVRLATVTALGMRADLCGTTLKAVIDSRNDKDQTVRQATIRALGKKAVLHGETLAAVVAGLADENSSVRRAAVEVLRGQAYLDYDTLKAIAARLEDEDEYVQRAAVKPLLDGMQDRGDFFRSLLDSPSVVSFYKILLGESFRTQLSWYIEDEGYSFNLPERIGRVSMNGKNTDVMAKIKAARLMDMPPISSST